MVPAERELQPVRKLTSCAIQKNIQGKVRFKAVSAERGQLSLKNIQYARDGVTVC